jgi:hypothetical protein
LPKARDEGISTPHTISGKKAILSTVPFRFFKSKRAPVTSSGMVVSGVSSAGA